MAADYARQQEPGFTDRERAGRQAEYAALTPAQRRMRHAWLERHWQWWRELDADTKVQRTIVAGLLVAMLIVAAIVAVLTIAT